MTRFAIAIVTALLLFISPASLAGTTIISPEPILHFVDNNGNPLVGGQLFTYAAGTTTPLATYTDATGATPNTNPIILNSRGEANVWLNPALAYKFILSPSTDSNPPTNPYWTVDQINSLVASNYGISVPCAGSADVASSIQAAVTLAQAAGGGTIMLSAGTCTVKSSVSITGSGIHIVGQGRTATTVKPVGNFNVFSFTGSAAVQDGGVSNLSFNSASQTGGSDIYVNNYQRTEFHDISSFSTLNFLYHQSANKMAVSDVDVFGISGNYCIDLQAPGSARTDVVDLTNITCGGAVGSTYIGLIIDGFVNTVNLHSYAVSKPNGGGILAENTVAGTQDPTFFFGHDFQVEGATNADGIHLTNMGSFYCADCYSSSNAGDGLYVGSASTDVNIANSMMELNGKYAVETYAFDGGTGTTGTSITGGNLSGNGQSSPGTYSNVLIGATSFHSSVVGVNLSGSQTNYGVTVQSGAQYVDVVGNNYVGATSGAVHDLSGYAAILGGVAPRGGPYGPSILDAGTGGAKQVTLLNNGTASGTAAEFVASTGTANAYLIFGNEDGSTPTGIIATGPGDTGGLDINTGAGDINLAPASGRLIHAEAPVRLPGYTVSTLPSCGVNQNGAMAFVTDASSPTYNGALTGGSGTTVPVFCNGIAWTAH